MTPGAASRGDTVPDSTPLAGSTFVVTGASKGIGLAIAEHIVRAGGGAIICARTEGPLLEAAAHLQRLGRGPVHPVVADVAQPGDVERVFDAAEHTGTVGGVVHCAAVLGAIGPVVTVAPERWFETLRINLFGTFLVTQAACKRMVSASQGGGSVVLLSGGGAGSAFPNYTAYACSKAAVVRFTESVALEVASQGIRVNCIGPGFVATGLHRETLSAGDLAGAEYLERTKAELARGGVPASLAAQAAIFLLSRKSAGITGRFVAVPYDDWEHWPEHVEQIRGSDLFTLRRIVPRDRGMDWQ